MSGKAPMNPIIDFYFGIGKDSRVIKIHRKRAKKLIKMFIDDPTIDTIKKLYKREKHLNQGN